MAATVGLHPKNQIHALPQGTPVPGDMGAFRQQGGGCRYPGERLGLLQQQQVGDLWGLSVSALLLNSSPQGRVLLAGSSVGWG